MERKLATVLFVDLVDSTGLVARSDPEVVRRRVSAFFDRAAQCVETHGGIVEKFAGDAVMAAFGIPRAHEDDGVRAVRAAMAILDTVHELGLEARMGIESGEVVTESADSTFATGEPVHVAARLQQTADAGQILVGPSAHRLAAFAVEFQPLGTRELRGHDRPLAVWQPIEARNGGPGPARIEAPLVGRDDDLELLENTYGRTARDRRAHLFTIYGDPGVGKSRLVREFVATLEGATVLQGRCLPYGEGITYWPVAEMVKAAAGISDDDPTDEAQEKLLVCCEDEAVADLLALAAGVLDAVDEERSQQEIAWAAREWAAQLGAAQPLVLVFEDIHWAEEPLLELIEHLTTSVRDAPLLILCLARPELLDVHSSWGGGRVRATAIELEPLAAEDSGELVDALLAETPLTRECREEILQVTEGNPLYVEETIRMLAEQNGAGGGNGDGLVGIPDTLQALIAARIDRLPPAHKLLLQRGAVIGRVFWHGAAEFLSPDLDGFDDLLDDLLQREFVLREPRSTITGERALRFKHVLIREVAYGGLSKAARASHHERFAEWLAERAGEELLEIRAYHLDRAATLMAELDGAPPDELAHEAAAALHTAGKRALAREGFRTARKLFLRAVELEPTLERRYLAGRAAWRLGDFPAVSVEMEVVRAAAHDAGERRLEGRALTALTEIALYQGADVPRARRLVEEALDVLADENDPQSRFEALMMRAQVASWLGEMSEMKGYMKQAREVAQQSGRKDLETMVTQSLAGMYIHRLDLEQAEPLVERAIELAEASGSILARANALQTRGQLERVLGRIEDATATFETARDLFSEIGYTAGTAYTSINLGRVARRLGDLEKAEANLRDAIRILKPIGDRGILCEAQRSLAELRADAGKLEEAERLALEARETVGPEDRISGPTTTLSLGVVRAAQGRDAEAEVLLRSALEGLTEFEFKTAEVEALEALIQFLRDRGREDEAEEFEARLAAIAELAPAYTTLRTA